jgi:hypothetical protein
VNGYPEFYVPSPRPTKGKPPGKHNAKVDEADGLTIRGRFDAGEEPERIAADYGLHPLSVKNIAWRKTWKNVG